ncbi:branched-chain amino acid transport system permease protein [Desulfohalotomaculum tongense]|uniref:branched-chain amino acid ABC transporter permease n=1 Tax=Desulforadius tongensis TaxID=1216062 RepID=UPI0019567300|nr:branched-chain amino acid ABC transporter permease [Desulforadius tongensis]MBM7854720.1 branched-chain amino acid transport system permease protein [Desulforadius tongensis]
MSAFLESILDPYYIQVLTLLGVYIIAALGLNLITGVTGMFSFGHAAYFAVGAYGAAILTVKYQFPFYGALLAGGIMAALAAVIIGFPALRLTGDYLGIVTLGFGEIIRVVFLNLDITGGALGLAGIAKESSIVLVYTLVLVTIYVMYALQNSRFGRALVAIREDDIAAEAMGINISAYKIKAFAIGCFFAGVAGALYAHLLLFLNPTDFGFAKSFEFLCFVVLGGLGSIPGVILGTSVLTLAPEFLRSLSDYRMLIYGALMVLMMIFRPNGLLGGVDLQRLVFKNKYKSQAGRSTAAGG